MPSPFVLSKVFRGVKSLGRSGALLLFFGIIAFHVWNKGRIGDPLDSVELRRASQLSLNPGSNNEVKIMTNDTQGSKDFPIRSYFQELYSLTGSCRKFARFGGDMQCRMEGEEIGNMDGDKMICMDPEMKIAASPRIEDCTVLSFGISTEFSFDLSMREANCRLFMFDILDQNSTIDYYSHMTFHEIGLGSESMYLHSTANNVTMEINTLELILTRFNLTSELIHVLKIDIEGSEWDVFDHLLKGNILLAVGQIAIEVHAKSFLRNVPEEDQEKKLKELFRGMRQNLLQLEKIGFRKVFYKDNISSHFIKDEEGTNHREAGELLLVNSNWYKGVYMPTG